MFVDYQNCYRRARGAFFNHPIDPHFHGQVDPLKLGQHLAADSPYDRLLSEVRVYRGMPSSTRDPQGYAACRRQASAWEQSAQVKVFSHPLQYIDDKHSGVTIAREKGVDVALAIDFATMAADKAYDVGIIVSLDTDLKPSLAYVCDKQRAWGKPRAEVAAWSAIGQRNGRLSIPGAQIYCHWLGRDVYDKISDARDYNLG